MRTIGGIVIAVLLILSVVYMPTPDFAAYDEAPDYLRKLYVNTMIVAHAVPVVLLILLAFVIPKRRKP